MRKLYGNARFLQGLLIVWLLLLYLPGLQVGEIPTANGTIPISWCYLFSVAFLPYLVLQFPRLRIPPWYLTGLYLFVLVWAAVQAPVYGLSKGILHWLFGAFLLLVLVNLGQTLSEEMLSNVLQTGILAFMACHLVYTLANWQTVYNVVFQDQMASTLASLTRGGRNLDATWLGLGCFLVRKPKWRIGCLLYSFAFAVIGVSRVGLIASGLCLLWILVYDPQFGFRKKTALFWGGLAAVGLVVALATGMAQRMYDRVFFGYGEGAISFLSGRETMWQNVLPMFKAHPFGVGVGNAIPVMRAEFGFSRYEDIMHNVFFQWLLDEGIIGGLWFLALAVLLLVSQKDRATGWFRQPTAAFLLGYLVLSMVQFHGGEALMIFTLGCFLLTRGQWITLHTPLRKAAQSKEAAGTK